MYFRLIVVFALLGVCVVRADALPVAAVAVSQTSNSALAANLKAIPYHAFSILYLPLGLGQTTASVFTGEGSAVGAQNMSRGIMAPVRLVQSVLLVPWNLIP